MTHQDTRSTTRRAFLANAFTGGVVGTAGCQIRMPTWLFGDPAPPPFGPVEHGWRMAGRDAANTAHNPGADGPESEPEPIWEFDVGEGVPQAVIEERTLAITVDDTLYVYDLGDGELAWTASVETHRREPMITSGRLYVQTADRELSCLDAETGERVWSATTENSVRTPVIDRETVVVSDGGGDVYAFEDSDGSERWRTDSEQQSTLGPHAVDEDVVYVGGENALVVLDLDTGEMQWRAEDNYGGLRPTVVDGVVYTGGLEIEAHSTNGVVSWRTDTGVGSFSTPTIVGDRACATRAGGRIQIRAVGSGELLWAEDTRSWDGRPITDGSTIYVASGDTGRRIYGLNPVTETVEWTKRVPEAPYSLRLVDDLLFVGMATGKLLAFR